MFYWQLSSYLSWCCLMLFRVNHSRPNYQINLGDDMTYSPAYAAYAPNTNFVNGRTLQAPVAGTIARGEQRFDYEATPQDAIRAGEQLSNPYAQTCRRWPGCRRPRGRRVSIILHGVPRGRRRRQRSGGDTRVSPATFPANRQIARHEGRAVVPHSHATGRTTCRHFAAQLPPDRRWDVINYIRRLQQAVQPPTPSAAPNTAPATEQPSALAPGRVLPTSPINRLPKEPQRSRNHDADNTNIIDRRSAVGSVGNRLGDRRSRSASSWRRSARGAIC